MKREPMRYYLSLLTAAVIIVSWMPIAGAAEKKDMGGWETDSPYNKHYDISELDYFRANVVRIFEVVPMQGMSPAVALEVRESEDETIIVHVCPTWFLDLKNTGLRRGDRVKIKGVWAEVEGKDIFMASKIKKGDFFELKVRLTKDGTPFWNMTPAQLAQEKAKE